MPRRAWTRPQRTVATAAVVAVILVAVYAILRALAAAIAAQADPLFGGPALLAALEAWGPLASLAVWVVAVVATYATAPEPAASPGGPPWTCARCGHRVEACPHCGAPGGDTRP